MLVTALAALLLTAAPLWASSATMPAVGGWGRTEGEPPAAYTVGSLALDPSHPAPDVAPPAGELASRAGGWPPWRLKQCPSLGVDPVPQTPHPAVARIIVPEHGSTAFGTGTLVDVRDEYGLVVTNWHVVRDADGVVEVVFPSGFRSRARPLKVDSDWDLAALVVWRPPVEPVQLADRPPQPGDRLTIHGYGRGQYRAAAGHCTSYYSPRIDYPMEMVELDVEARQGDSGGPIFNDRGQLAGVLFGAGQGTTIGSFGPRVKSFLASLAPDIGTADETMVAVADRPAPDVHTINRLPAPSPADGQLARSTPVDASRQPVDDGWSTAAEAADHRWPTATAVGRHSADEIRTAGRTDAPTAVADEHLSWQDVAGTDWFERAKTVFALVGIVAVALQLVKAVR